MFYFCCPVCGGMFQKQAGVLRCSNKHTFDLAAQGYAHLLLANKMHSKLPGDDKSMVAARRLFLDAGGYDLFAKTVAELAARQAAAQKKPVILDAGCGEGYYTTRIAAALPDALVAGFDISKAAIKAAAKRYKSCQFAVASIFAIPAPDASADCVIDVFAPAVEKEFCRVLKKGGSLIYAVPSRRHLYGLKEILYDAPYENEEKDTEYEGFRFVERVEAHTTLQLQNPDLIHALFVMTPYYWNTPKEGAQRLAQCSTLSTEIGFDFLIYQKL